MKFQVSTAPLNDALSLGVVNANVSNYFKRSYIAQITASKSDLTINLEASQILSEIRLKGMGDVDDDVTTFVSSILLKQLVSTFVNPVTNLEFVEGGLIIHSGKSKFTLPKLDVDVSSTSLNKPEILANFSDSSDIDKEDWKFIKNYQMYAIAMSFAKPVYNRVWVGDHGDVIVGDFDQGLFTHSEKSKLGTTCLLKDSIVNLFNSLPDGAKICKVNDTYVIKVTTDGFEFISEFQPEYEDDESIGSYNSDMIIEMMSHTDDKYSVVPTAAINKFMSQADLLSDSSTATIKFRVDGNTLTLKDDNVDCTIDLESLFPDSYEVEFLTTLLKSVLSNYNDETVCIAPIFQGDEVSGIKVWSKELTTVLAGVD